LEARPWRAAREKLRPAKTARATPEAVTFLDHRERPRARFAANRGDLSHTASTPGAIDSEKTLP
jgi:hypothetical protein